VSVGSGSPFVCGLREEAWRGTPTVAEGVDLALRGLWTAMRRDSASGDGYAEPEVTADGYRELGPDELAARRQRRKLAP